MARDCRNSDSLCRRRRGTLDIGEVKRPLQTMGLPIFVSAGSRSTHRRLDPLLIFRLDLPLTQAR